MNRSFVFFTLLFVMIAPPSTAQIRVTYPPDICTIGDTCSFDVWVNAGASLGRLAVVLKYNNAAITIVSLDDHHFMPVTQSLQFFNDICTQTILCTAPGSCGQIDYLGLDSSSSTLGHHKIFTVHYQITSTSQLNWDPCSAWCNPQTCVSLTPFAGSYDGTVSHSMYYYPNTLIASDDPLFDTDGDGLSDDLEILIGTDPFDADSDDDGIPDGVDPSPKEGRTPAGEDVDLDGYIAPWETDPADADSDDDGLFDGTESGLTAPMTPDTDLSAGTFVADADPMSTTNPIASDTDGDGSLDGVEDANGNGAVDPGEADPDNGASVPPLEPPADGIAVLLLGDTGSTADVQAAIEGAGHTVTVVDPYYNWDGVTPSVDDFGVVILLDGYDYGYDLDPAASAALATHVEGGGGLILSEWVAYDVYNGSKTGPFTTTIPVVAPDGDYSYGATWNVTSTHELTQGVPASWTESDEGSSICDPSPGAIVLARDDDGVPLLTYSSQLFGRVVYVNNTLTYSSSIIDPNILKVIVNSVGYVDRRPLFADGFETGDTARWAGTH